MEYQKITKFSKNENDIEIPKERYIFPEERKK